MTCSVTALGGSAAICAATLRAASGFWVGAHTSQRSACTSARQFIGSIAACATSGSSYVAATVCAAPAKARSTSPSLRTTRSAATVASRWHSARRCAESSPVAPADQFTRSARRASMAAQVDVAMTATPFAGRGSLSPKPANPSASIGTTSVTPGILRAASASNSSTRAPMTGARSITAKRMPGTRASRPKSWLPSTSDAASRWGVGLPIRVKRSALFRGTSVGTGRSAAAAASAP